MTTSYDDYVDSTGRYNTGYNFQFMDAIATAHQKDEFVRLHERKHDSEQEAVDRERIGHEKQHSAEKVGLEAALASEKRRLAEHQVAHDAAHTAHSEMHDMEGTALNAALEAEQRRLQVHNTAHDHAHNAHEQLHRSAYDAHVAQHGAEDRAVDLAQKAMDKRLDGMNEFRDQLRDQASTFVRRDQLDSFIAQYERAHAEVVSLIATEREERRADEGRDTGSLDARTLTFSIVGVLIAISVLVLGIAQFVAK